MSSQVPSAFAEWEMALEKRLSALLGNAAEEAAQSTDRLLTWGSHFPSHSSRTWSYEEELSVSASKLPTPLNPPNLSSGPVLVDKSAPEQNTDGGMRPVGFSEVADASNAGLGTQPLSPVKKRRRTSLPPCDALDDDESAGMDATRHRVEDGTTSESGKDTRFGSYAGNGRGSEGKSESDRSIRTGENSRSSGSEDSASGTSSSSENGGSDCDDSSVSSDDAVGGDAERKLERERIRRCQRAMQIKQQTLDTTILTSPALAAGVAFPALPTGPALAPPGVSDKLGPSSSAATGPEHPQTGASTPDVCTSPKGVPGGQTDSLADSKKQSSPATAPSS